MHGKKKESEKKTETNNVVLVVKIVLLRIRINRVE